MKTETELFENALDTTSVNDKKLREYINENYISNSVLDKIRIEILEKCFDVPYKNQAFDYGLKIVKWSDVREILDKYYKYKAESENKE